MMKLTVNRSCKLACFLICVQLCTAVYAQVWKETLGDEWYNKKRMRFQVGDTIPDINLGELVSGSIDKTNLHSFKGKLVILDFWNTACSACIEAFPKMAKLQKAFGEKIQILLMNQEETGAQIMQRLSHRKKITTLKYNNNDKEDITGIFHDLPVLADTGLLKKKFPLRGVPELLWIDRNSILRVTGSPYNATSEKVQSILDGKDVDYMQNSNTAPYFNAAIPYYTIMENAPKKMQRSSVFTRYNNEYAPWGGKAVNIIDTFSGTRRNTYINQEVLELYAEAYKDLLDTNNKSVIYSDNYYRFPGTGLDYFELDVADTTRYTSMFAESLKGVALSDKTFMKSRFCYEIVRNMNIGEKIFKTQMLQDLNDFFSGLYGTQVTSKKKNIDCYVVVSINNRSIDSADSYEKKSKKDKDYSLYRPSFKNMMGEYLLRNSKLRKSLSPDNTPLFVLNEIKAVVGTDFTIPDTVAIDNLENFKKLLNSYGLDIIKEKRNIEFIVITEMPLQY